MKVIADLHMHSRFSRATSKFLDIENLEKWAMIKGINLLGTGDFTHPAWFKELKENLHEENGIMMTKNNFPFVFQTEICLMYSQDNKGRRVHLVILSPSLEVTQQINTYLGKKGRLDYDGRPIFNITCPELAESLMSISKEIEIIPAHAWTPWFGIFGSMSGFDSMEEAFKDKTNYIHAFETGMSSDPEMNWRLSKLDKYSIVSFSDSHSFWPWRLGREATAFEMKELNYKNLVDAIRNNKIEFTIETSPSYGKYHFDGHRHCNFSCSPEEAAKLNNICPVCRKPLTIGVLHRVNELADRDEGFRPNDAKEFKSVLPLSELIAMSMKAPLESKKVMDRYNELIKNNSELDILIEMPVEQLTKLADDRLIGLILFNRHGRIKVKPGYDGEYGIPMLEEQKQTKLF